MHPCVCVHARACAYKKGLVLVFLNKSSREMQVSSSSVARSHARKHTQTPASNARARARTHMHTHFVCWARRGAVAAGRAGRAGRACMRIHGLSLSYKHMCKGVHMHEQLCACADLFRFFMHVSSDRKPWKHMVHNLDFKKCTCRLCMLFMPAHTCVTVRTHARTRVSVRVCLRPLRPAAESVLQRTRRVPTYVHV